MNYSMNFIVAAIFVGLTIRIVMHFIDKNRIKDEIESKGGRVISIAWNPFARGWFFEKKTSAIMKSPMSIVQDRPYRRRAKRAFSQESTGLKGHNWSNLRHGLFRDIIVPHAAMR